MKKIWLFLTCLLIMVATANALSCGGGAVCGLNITNVSISPVSAACNDAVIILANVQDKYNASAGVNSVTFVITESDGVTSQDRSKSAHLFSGTKVNGMWVANVTVDGAAGVKNWTVKSVDAINAALNHCLATDDLQDGGCDVRFGNRNASISCPCAPNITYGDCNKDNVQPKYVTYPSGCGMVDQETTSHCDFCNPDWVPTSGICTIGTSTDDQLYLRGTTSSSFIASPYADYPNGSYCCGAVGTGLAKLEYNHNGGSDCDEPPNQGEQMCVLDAWTKYGDDFAHSASNKPTLYSKEYFGYETSGNVETTIARTFDLWMQPIVYDWDNDGMNEVIFVNGGTLYVYSYNSGALTMEASFTVAGGTFYGQPALQGVEEFAPGEFRCYLGGSVIGCPTQIVVPVSIGGNNIYLKSYVYNGTLSEENSLDITNPLDGGNSNFSLMYGSGVECVLGNCFIKIAYGADQEAVIKFDSNFNSISDWGPFPANVSTDNSTSVPLYSGNLVTGSYDGTGNIIGVANAPNGIIYYCPASGAMTCFESNLPAGCTFQGITFSSGKLYADAFCSITGGSYYYIFRFNASSGIQQSAVQLWGGRVGDERCLSSPVEVTMGSDKFIGIGHYNYDTSSLPAVRNNWTLYAPSFTTENLHEVRVSGQYVLAINFPGTSLYKYGINHIYFYDGASWAEILQPNSTLTGGQTFYGYDKASDGNFYMLYHNSSGYYDYKIIKFSPTNQTYSLYASYTLTKYVSTFSTSTYLNFYCDRNNFECWLGAGFAAYECGYTPCDNSVNVTVQRLVPSLTTPIYLPIAGQMDRMGGYQYVDGKHFIWMSDTFGYNPTFRLYEWNGVSWVMRYSEGQGSTAVPYDQRRWLGIDDAFRVATVRSSILYYNSTSGLWYPANYSYKAYHVMSLFPAQSKVFMVNSTTIARINYDENDGQYHDIIYAGSANDIDFDYATGIGWVVGNSGKAYQYIPGGTITPSGGPSAIDLVNANTMVKQKTIPLNGTTCRINGGLTSADVNDDGYQEIFSGAGMFDTKGAIRFGGYSVMDLETNSLTIPVDLNGDMYLDLLTFTGNYVITRITVPPVSPVIEGNLSLTEIRPCQVTNGKTLNVGIWGKTPDLGTTYFTMNPGDGSITQGQYYTGSESNLFTYTYGASADYTVTGGICVTESNVTSCVYDDCNVTANVTGAGGYCFWGDDGSFNWYPDDVTLHGWTVLNRVVILQPNLGILSFTSDVGIEFAHAALCNQRNFIIEFKMKQSALSDSMFYVKTGSGQMLGAMEFKNGMIYDNAGNVLSNYTSSWGNYSIMIDKNTGITYYVSGGIAIGEYSWIDQISTNSSTLFSLSVGVVYTSGTLDIDYIQISGTGGTMLFQNKTAMISQTIVSDLGCDPNKLKALSGCNPNTLLTYSQAKKAGNAVSSYQHIDSLAKSCSNLQNGYLDYNRLTDIIKIYPDCFKEVFNYCVDVTYPSSVGIDTSNTPPEGVTVCTTVIGTGTLYTKAIVPAISSLWASVSANFIVLIIVIVIILAVVGFLSRK